ncbi:MAG: endonuclease/exonuclease/phosphatase family protein [Desulfatiglandales bacterium]
MRFISFNMRFENDRDGGNSWSNRRDFVIRLVKRYAPDALGTQEGKWSQLLFLRDRLPEYAMQATNRVIDDTSQYPTLFIRKASFEVMEGEEFWLSKTPRVNLSKDWDSAFPRMMSAARLRCRRSGYHLWAVVTHLDHMGVEARYRQAQLLADWVSKQAEPVVVMGDFNEGPESRVHAALTSERTDLMDTWQRMGGEEGESSYTHHGFDGVPRIARLDWILASRRLIVEDIRIIRDREDGRYPSDHFPLLADLAFPAAENL